MAGVGYGCSYTPPIQALIEWFPDKRGLASGVVIAGFGSGALFFTPAMNALMQKVSIPWLLLCTTTLKENYSIIPLLIVLTVSCSIGISFAIRFAMISPEVNWAKRSEPWEDYRDGKAVKFFNPLGTSGKTELPEYKTK